MAAGRPRTAGAPPEDARPAGSPPARPQPFLHPDPATGPRPAAAVGAGSRPVSAPGGGEPGPGRAAETVRAGGAARGPVAGREEWRWAALSYLGIPFLSALPPLAVYLATPNMPFARRHATQGLNLAVTVLLYNVCALIIGAVLALDSLRVALAIVSPVTAALWLVALNHLVRCALAAGRGEFRPIPAWLCATIVL